MTNLQSALSHYTIEDATSFGQWNIDKLLPIMGRMTNADRLDQEEYLERLSETKRNQPKL